MHEEPLFPLWVTLFLAIWGVVAPFLGVLAGSFLTSWWQHKQWVLDNKKQEYRELLSALSDAYGRICILQQPGVASGPEEQRTLQETHLSALRTIRDRIFIVSDLNRDEILKLWLEATDHFENDRLYLDFRQRYNEINSRIVKAAHKLL